MPTHAIAIDCRVRPPVDRTPHGDLEAVIFITPGTRHFRDPMAGGLTDCNEHPLQPTALFMSVTASIRHRRVCAGVDTPAARFFINCLAEPAEVVAEYLVPRIRKAPQESRGFGGKLSRGLYIRYLSKPKAYGQIAMRLLFGQRKNRFMQEES